MGSVFHTFMSVGFTMVALAAGVLMKQSIEGVLLCLLIAAVHQCTASLLKMIRENRGA